jgi:hypothetical protein
MMIRKIGQGVVVTAAAVVLAAGGTFALAGTALADGHCCDSHGHDGEDGQDGDSGRHVEYNEGNGGGGGNGGRANSNCVVPLGVSAGVVGQGGPVSQCNSSGGSGGDAGDGAGGGE